MGTKEEFRDSKVLYQKVLFVSLIIVMVIASAVMIFFRFVDKPLGGQIVSQRTQALNGVEKDITFDIIVDEEIDINNENLLSYVVVTDFHSNVVDIGSNKLFGEKNIFAITPPVGNYIEGEAYRITLTDCKFFDEQLKDNDTLIFTIVRDEMSIIDFSDTVKKIDKDAFVANEDDNLILKNDVRSILSESKGVNGYQTDDDDIYKVGDILIVPTYNQERDYYEDIAHKVTDVQYIDDIAYIKTTTPSLNETYDSLEVYGSFAPSEQFRLLSNEEIVDSIMNLDSIKAVDYAVGEYNDQRDWTTGGGVDIDFDNKNKGFPKKVEVDLNIKIKPNFEIGGSITVGWELFKDNDSLGDGVNEKVDLTLSLTLGITYSIMPYSNISESNGVSQ